MKRNVYYLSVLLLAGCMVGGCSDEQGNTANVPVASGEPIRFSVSTDNVKSRTVYDELEEDGWTLDWVTGDEIGIYTTAEDKYVVKWNSGGTPVNDGSKYAVYYINEVNPQGHQHEGTIYWNGDHLVWGESVSEENPWLTFYGAYPAEEVIGTNYPYDGSEGIIQMDYHTNQLAVINKKEGDTYVAPPDMKEAYMIAKRNIQPSGEHILLDFDPIMTTLNLNITAGGYEEKTGIIDPVTITGVSVMMPHGINNGEFKYDTAGMENDGTHGKLAEGIQSDYKESIYVGIQNGLDNNKRYIDLFEGESVNLFAFLPPVNMKNGATIKVHTKGALNFVLDITQEMIQQSRIDIQLPDVSPESENELMVNNWISQLDGNIYVSNLSIPGMILNSLDEIHDLLKKGVRVFNVMELSKDDQEEASSLFNNYLNSNTNEFMVMLCSYDVHKNNLTGNILDYSGQMTINDARNHIIALKAYSGKNIIGNMNNVNVVTNISDIHYSSVNSISDIITTEKSGWTFYEYNQDNYVDIMNTDSQKGSVCFFLMKNSNISDLFIQSIIDCNYKFILDRNWNQP